MALQGAEIEVDGLTGYLARPDQPSRAGVLIQPSHYGMEEHAIENACKLAEAGLVGVIWNQYTDLAKRAPVHEEASDWGRKLNDDRALEQMAAWLTYMRADLGLERLGVLGFCQGGRFALLVAARDRRVSACASYYPSIRDTLPANQKYDVTALAGEIRCPVHVIYPGKDHVTGWQTFARLQENLQQRRELTSVQLYPEAEHGFMTVEEHPGEANAQAVRASWPECVGFLNGTLT